MKRVLAGVVKRTIAVLLAAVLVVSFAAMPVDVNAAEEDGSYSFTAGELTVKLNEKGEVTGLLDENGKDYAVKDPELISPLIKLVLAPEEGELSGKDGTEAFPEKLTVDGDVLTFSFEKGIEVDITKTEKDKYTVLEVTRMEKNGVDVELLMWGPIMTTIMENFGETLGVVYDSQFAIGYRGLNDKTQMNAPFEYVGETYNGSTHLNVAYPQDRSRFEGRVWDLKMSAAVPTEFGSYLMGFTYDSTVERVRWAQYPGTSGMQRVPALSDESEASIEGSKIALYGRSKGEEESIGDAILDTISDMELAEGLPHPLCTDGEWQKTSPLANQPYFIITDLDSTDTEKMAKARDYAVDAGYRFVYKDTFINSYGTHTFAGGDDAMKAVVDTAGEKDVYVGTHTLSGFISNGDPYASGEKGTLAGSREAYLTEAAAEGSTEIHVTEDYAGGTTDMQLGKNRFNVTDAKQQSDGTYILTLDTALKYACEEGEALYKLYRNQYGSMIAGADQTYEVAGNIARALNNTGMMQMSFDGVEAGSATGFSNYHVNQMINGMYEQLNPEQQKYLISDSSGGYPNAWHVSTRENWGEPWGAGMREGMIEYRYDNQLYYDRNFIPRMLGWFMYNSGQPTIDIEWMLAKSAGFDAGFALNTSLGTMDGNGNTADVIDALREWEEAREADAFTEEQQERLLDTSLDWHLKPVEGEDAKWLLYCIDYQANPITHTFDGQPLEYREFNPYHAQPLYIELKAVNGAVSNPVISNGTDAVTVKGSIPNGYYLIYNGGASAQLYDGLWNEKGELPVEGEGFDLPQGVTNLTVDFGADNNSVTLEARVQTESYPEEVYYGNPAKGPAEYPMEDTEGEITDETRENQLLNKTVEAYSFETGEELDLDYLESVTDGERERTDETFAGRFEQKPYLQIDIGANRVLDTIRYYGDHTGNYPDYTNTPHNVVIAISTTPDFAEGTYKVIYNTDKNNMWGFGAGTDTEEVNQPGCKVFEFEPTEARYVRYYQYGATQTGASNMETWMSLCELEAYAQLGPHDVEKIEINNVQTSVGVKPVLPDEAVVVYGNGLKEKKSVDWSDISEDQYSKPGQFTVEGAIEGVDLAAKCVVTVRNAPVSLLTAPAAVLNTDDSVTVGLSAFGTSDITEIGLRIYWDKTKLRFDNSKDNVEIKVPGVELKNFTVNNESALIDMDLEAEAPLSEDELSHILDLKFGIVQDAEGIASVETKVMNLTGQDGQSESAENYKVNIHVLPEEQETDIYDVVVKGGVGSGQYKAGEEVTVSAEIPEGKTFTGWKASGIKLTDEQVNAESFSFTMPENDVRLEAGFEDVQEPARDNLLLNKTVEAYNFETGEKLDLPLLQSVTDGVLERTDDTFSGRFPQKQYLQIDIGEEQLLDTVLYYGDCTADYPNYTNTPYNVVIAVSTTPDFAEGTYKVIYNTDQNNIWGFGEGTDQAEVNTPEAKVFEFEPTPARYVRYYQYGAQQDQASSMETWVSLRELEAYGTQAEEPEEPEEPSAVRELLQKTYDMAKDMDTSAAIDSAVKVFEDALRTAEELLANPEATDEEMLEAWNELVDAVHGLGLEKGDKSVLQVLIDKAEEMIQDADKYVEKNWQLLLDELEDAKAVMDDPDAMDDTIQPAEDELLNAILAQKYKANKDNLKELVESLKNLDLTKYTEESVKVFEEAMAQADVILADETLSADDQDKVDAAVEELTAARDGLVEKTDGSGDEGGDGDTGNSGDEGNEGNTGNSGDEGNEGNTGNSGDDSNKENIGQENGNEESGTDGTANKAPKTGDNTPLTMALFFMVLSAGTAVCVIRRKTK